MKNLKQYITLYLKRETLVLLIIFLIALFLRTYRLGSLPYGFHEDEVSNTYIGRFIFENGKDLYGNMWPLLYFDKFGDYPPILPMYFSGLATYIFGITEFAARIPFAFVGALTIFPLYYIVRFLSQNKTVGYVSSFFLAITPWHIVYSRATAEGIVAVFLYICGLFLVLKSLDNSINKGNFIFGSSILFLTYFIYPSFRLLIPLSFLPLPFIFRYKKNLSKTAFIVLVLSFLLLFWIVSTPWGRARYEQTSLFTNPTMKETIENKLEALSYGVGQNNIIEARIFHNKFVGYTREFLYEYFKYFSPEYLLLKGGEPYRYFSVPEQGMLYITFLPLLLIGILVGFKYLGNYYLYLLYLFFISPIPGALTVDFTPHFHRAILLMVPILIFAAIGFSFLVQRRCGKYIFAALSVFILSESIYASHQYIRQSDSYKPGVKNDSNREAVLYVKNNRDKYDKVIMPNKEKLAIYYLFFTGDFSPDYIGKFGYNMTLNNVDSVSFMDEWCLSEKIEKEELQKNILVVENGDCTANNNFKEIHLITRKDSTNAFRFLVPIQTL